MKGFFESLFKRDDKVVIKDKLYFIKTENILQRDENKSGVITGFDLDPKYKFYQIKLDGKPEISSKKRGVSRVVQNLSIPYKNPGAIMDDLSNIKATGKGVSILHIDSLNKAFLYGEHKGLTIMELSENLIVLQGEETDTFFEVEYSLSQKITEDVG